MKHRKSVSWIYLSRLAAVKEYAYMKVCPVFVSGFNFWSMDNIIILLDVSLTRVKLLLFKDSSTELQKIIFCKVSNRCKSL